MKRFVLPLLLAAAFLLYSCPEEKPDNGSKPVAVDVAVPADLMGVVHAGSKKAIILDGDIDDQEYKILDEIGAIWMLTDFTWNDIQPADKKDSPPEDWNWTQYDNYVKNAADRGKKIMAMMGYSVGWLHGEKTTETVTVKDHMGADSTVDVYTDGHIGGGRCIVGEWEVAQYCAFLAAVVTRYDGKHGHGKVDAFRIWNEPNLFPRFWTGISKTDMENIATTFAWVQDEKERNELVDGMIRTLAMNNFFVLSKAALKAAKEADPDALIGVGALNSIATSDWILSLYSSGAAQGADWVAFHPYSLNATGTTGVLQNFIDKSDPPFRNKVWVTEVGHPTSGGLRAADWKGYGTEVDQDLKMPQTIVKTITVMATQSVQKIFWYQLSDGGPGRNSNDSEAWFGLYQLDSAGNFEPKGKLPAAYKLAAENIPGKTWRVAGLPGLALPATVQSYYFEGLPNTPQAGKHCLVVWNNSFFSTPEVTINLPAGTNHTVYDLGKGVDNEWKSAPSSDNKYTLSTRDAENEHVLVFTWAD